MPGFPFRSASQRALVKNSTVSETDSIMGDKTVFATPNSSRPSTPAKPTLVINTAKKGSPQRPPSPPLTAVPSGEDAMQDDMQKYRASVKSTLDTLSVTFAVLGDQAVRYAELGPAIDAGQKLADLSKELNAQYDRQDEAMKAMKDRLSGLYKGELARSLRAHMEKRVEEKIAERVEAKVREQLSKQVPVSLRQELTSHKRQVLQIQTSLHNSEARRHNALLHIQDGTEALRPLHRPFIQISAANLGPAPPSPPRSAGSPASDSLEPPTPSPFFPKKVSDLIDLTPVDARKLVADYGLERGESPRSGSPDAEFLEKNSNLNRFLAHIGAPYQLLHNPTSPATPLIQRAAW